MKRLLITGVTGFAGGHVAEALLLREDIEIIGVSRHGKWPEDLQHLSNRIQLLPCDLTEAEDIGEILRDAAPHWILHLAGYASVANAENAGTEAWAGNLTATENLYRAVGQSGGQPKILYVGSGFVYANPNDVVPDETCELRGQNVYAGSKCAADKLSADHCRKGLQIVRARPLNHIGPRQSSEYAVASFARQIALIEAGRQEPVIETGNLAARRDVTDVRDVAQAYVALLNHGRAGEAYNIASERLYSMRAILQRLLGMSSVEVEIRRQERLVRQVDPPVLRINAAKLRRETGWQPGIGLAETLQDTLSYWRTRVEQATLAA